MIAIENILLFPAFSESDLLPVHTGSLETNRLPGPCENDANATMRLAGLMPARRWNRCRAIARIHHGCDTDYSGGQGNRSGDQVMKWLSIVFIAFALFGVLPVSQAEDAAIEAQEGHIDHWIEYYRKERQGNEIQPAREADANTKSQQLPADSDQPVSAVPGASPGREDARQD